MSGKGPYFVAQMLALPLAAMLPNILGLNRVLAKGKSKCSLWKLLSHFISSGSQPNLFPLRYYAELCITITKGGMNLSYEHMINFYHKHGWLKAIHIFTS